MFKISLFGWELVLLRYSAKPKVYDKQGIQPSGAYLKKEGNFLLAVNKDGQYINAQIELTLNDSVDGPSTMTVKYFFAGIYDEIKGEPPK